MLPLPAFVNTPFRHALWATAFMALAGVLVRYGWGAFDPEMRTWTLVAVSPSVGLLVYFQKSNRPAVVSAMLIGTGTIALGLWTFLALSGLYPITSRADLVGVIVLFAIALGTLALGLWQWRRLRAA